MRRLARQQYRPGGQSESLVQIGPPESNVCSLLAIVGSRSEQQTESSSSGLLGGWAEAQHGPQSGPQLLLLPWTMATMKNRAADAKTTKVVAFIWINDRIQRSFDFSALCLVTRLWQLTTAMASQHLINQLCIFNQKPNCWRRTEVLQLCKGFSFKKW